MPEVVAVAPTKAKRGNRAKEKQLLKEFGGRQGITEEQREVTRNKLKTLIKLGKERGFLTYAEINDHLPDDLVDAEAIEAIISTFSDMGIQVYDQAPDAETLLMAGTHAGGQLGRRCRGGGRSRAVDGRLRVRPHHRPGAHVHARDGLGRAADARGRDRDRQAHRGRPEAHGAGDLGLPDHDCRDRSPTPRRSAPARCASTRWSTA